MSTFVLVDQATQDRSTRDAFTAEVRDGVGRPWWAKVAGAVGSSTLVMANIFRLGLATVFAPDRLNQTIDQMMASQQAATDNAAADAPRPRARRLRRSSRAGLAVRLTIFVGEGDTWHHKPLCTEDRVPRHQAGLAGASGIKGYGAQPEDGNGPGGAVIDSLRSGQRQRKYDLAEITKLEG
jgi:hypothetical protein